MSKWILLKAGKDTGAHIPMKAVRFVTSRPAPNSKCQERDSKHVSMSFTPTYFKFLNGIVRKNGDDIISTLFYTRLELRWNHADQCCNFQEITHKETNKNQYAGNRPASQSSTALLVFTLASPPASLPPTSASILLLQMLSANKLFFETHHTDSLLFKYPSQHSLPTR
jgi:hypothetical protein